VTVRDLTVRDAPTEGGVAVWGARLWQPSGGALPDVTFDNVHFRNNAGRGIEIHNHTTVTNLVVQNSLFEGNGGHGIRASSTARVAGFDILNTTFRHNGGAGLAQSPWTPPTPGPNSYLDDLHVDNSLFDGNTLYGVYLGDARGVLIENSTFTGGGGGVWLVDDRDTPDPIGGVTIRDNQMGDFGGPAVRVRVSHTALDEPLTVTGNTIAQDVALLTADAATIEIALAAGHAHAAATVADNTITHSGALAAAGAAHGILLSGAPGSVALTGNALDGNGAGAGASLPPSSGLLLLTRSAGYGDLGAAGLIDVSLNEIDGFTHGVTVYDEVGGDYGGLPAGSGLSIVRNSLAGNSAFGARGGDPEPAVAICNWWGAADGPGGVGPGAGDDVSAGVLFAPWLASADLAASLCGSVNDLFVGTNRKGVVAGIPFDDVDIMALDRDAGVWSLFFDGGDVGVVTNLTGFTFEPGGCLLLAFDGNEKKLPGLGLIKPHDILKFCPTSLGETTAGAWSIYVDGSDVGLNAAGEKLDALEILPDGRLLLSTKGDFSVKDAANATLTGRDEDILVFDPTALGATTAGSFALYLDGSNIPGMIKEDITGIYYNPLNGDLHVTILGTFNVGGLAGDSNDIIILRPGGGGHAVLPYWNGPDDGWPFVLRSMHVDLP